MQKGAFPQEPCHVGIWPQRHYLDLKDLSGGSHNVQRNCIISRRSPTYFGDIQIIFRIG